MINYRLKNMEKSLINYAKFFGIGEKRIYFQRIKIIKDVYSGTKIYHFNLFSQVAKSDY
jgi:hypothetical protein